MDVYLQLDPKAPRVIKVTAAVEQSSTDAAISAQFFKLQPFQGRSGISVLLEGVTEADLEDAAVCVARKTEAELTKTFGPNLDTMLMVLCCQKLDTPELRAKVSLRNLVIIFKTFESTFDFLQILALTKRLLSSPDSAVRRNIVQKNAIGSSALEYTAINNKPALARFLAEMFYAMGEDLTIPDKLGNTLLHLMARKGDEVAPTLKTLLDLRWVRFAHLAEC
jgi:hypothetical protein